MCFNIRSRSNNKIYLCSFHLNIHYFQMYCNLCLALVVLIGPALSDKSSPETVGATDTDSYENGVGTSFTVPLNPQIVPAVSKNARKYSVSGDDLERSDLSLSPSHPVYSYSAPVNNLDTYVAPNNAGVDVAEARDGAGGHHHHHHHAEHAAEPAAAAPGASYEVTKNSSCFPVFCQQAKSVILNC